MHLAFDIPEQPYSVEEVHHPVYRNVWVAGMKMSTGTIQEIEISFNILSTHKLSKAPYFIITLIFWFQFHSPISESVDLIIYVIFW